MTFHKATKLGDYEIRSHAEIGELAEQLHQLAALAFTAFPGVIQPSSAHREWYVRRPGMDRDLSTAALHHGQLVGSAFVTVLQMRLGGHLRPVGVVDTVMTHPDHRRRGLARRVLTTAIEGMRERELAASLLYTIDGSIPYRFYQSLDYKPHAPIRYLRRIQPEAMAPASALQLAAPSDDSRLVEFLNACFARHEGYVPLDEHLWCWRRRERPAELPADTYVVQESGRILGCVGLCQAPVVASTHGSASWVLTDLAIASEAVSDEVLTALLSAAPSGAEVLVLSASVNVNANRLLTACGFVETMREVGMLLPIDPQLEATLALPPNRWYVLNESVIGV